MKNKIVKAFEEISQEDQLQVADDVVKLAKLLRQPDVEFYSAATGKKRPVSIILTDIEKNFSDPVAVAFAAGWLYREKLQEETK